MYVQQQFSFFMTGEHWPHEKNWPVEMHLSSREKRIEMSKQEYKQYAQKVNWKHLLLNDVYIIRNAANIDFLVILFNLFFQNMKNDVSQQRFSLCFCYIITIRRARFNQKHSEPINNNQLILISSMIRFDHGIIEYSNGVIIWRKKIQHWKWSKNTSESRVRDFKRTNVTRYLLVRKFQSGEVVKISSGA